MLLGKLKNLWQGNLENALEDKDRINSLLFKGFYDNRRLIKTHGKEKAKLRREKEKGMQDELAKAQLDLERDPQNQQYQALLTIKVVELKDFMCKQSQWMMETARLKWLLARNKCPPYICGSFKQ